MDKVIKGIECHRRKVQTTNAVSCLECPYSEPKPIREWCMSGLMDDIYALLKEQEAITIKKTKEHGFGVYGGICPKCRNWIQSAHSYCGFCGQAVKWDA